jgi:hypothetical protein
MAPKTSYCRPLIQQWTLPAVSLQRPCVEKRTLLLARYAVSNSASATQQYTRHACAACNIIASYREALLQRVQQGRYGRLLQDCQPSTAWPWQEAALPSAS